MLESPYGPIFGICCPYDLNFFHSDLVIGRFNSIWVIYNTISRILSMVKFLQTIL